MKLNVGSSSCHLNDWINLEFDENYWKQCKFTGEKISSKATRNMPDVFGDGRNLNYPDNHFDELRSSHVLEHIPQQECLKTLKEWYRVLKPQGVIRVIVPDFGFVIDKWKNKENNKEWWDVYLNDKGLYMESERKTPFDNIDDCMMHIFYLNGHHVNAFTYDRLKYLLEEVGFKSIERCDDDEKDIPDCTVCDLSLRLKGVKSV